MYDEIEVDVIEHESGLLRARIVVDEVCAFPEWDEVELTTVAAAHLSGGHTWDAKDRTVTEAYGRFRYFAREGKYANRRDYSKAERMLERYMRVFHDSTVVVRHSAGQGPSDWVDIAYVATGEVARDAIEAFAGEVERWRAGETFGVIIERRDSEDIHDDDAWVETDDSCWGFVGEDYAREEAADTLAWAAKHEPLQLALEA